MQHQIEAANAEVGKVEEQILVSMLEADELSAALKAAEAQLRPRKARSPRSAPRSRPRPPTKQQALSDERAPNAQTILPALEPRAVSICSSACSRRGRASPSPTRPTATARSATCGCARRSTTRSSPTKRSCSAITASACCTSPACTSAQRRGPGRARRRPRPPDRPRATDPVITAHVDGGARGNPGPAGYGAVITDEGGTGPRRALRRHRHLHQQRRRISRPARGAAVGARPRPHPPARQLRFAAHRAADARQLPVKHEGLIPLYRQARHLVARIGHVTFEHVRRELNKDADRLSNLGMDQNLVPRFLVLVPRAVLRARAHARASCRVRVPRASCGASCSVLVLRAA